MDIFQVAEQHFVLTFSIALAVGLLQGAILARGIRHRFPSLKRHARIASSTLLVLFLINAITNIYKFANPDKFFFSTLSTPSSPEEILAILVNALGINAGFVTVVVLFISITIMLILRFAVLPNIARYFVFGLSVVIVSVAVIARFTDFVPTLFQVIVYAFYQFGITIGIFFVTRKHEDVLPEVK